MKPKIIIVKEAPRIAGLYIQQGFRDAEAVMRWALTHGYAEVYYLPKHQRVYVDRANLLVKRARQVERQSKEVMDKVLAAVESL